MEKTVTVLYDEFQEMKERIKELEENQGKIMIHTTYEYYCGTNSTCSYFNLDEILVKLHEENVELKENASYIIAVFNKKIRKIMRRNLWERIINKQETNDKSRRDI